MRGEEYVRKEEQFALVERMARSARAPWDRRRRLDRYPTTAANLDRPRHRRRARAHHRGDSGVRALPQKMVSLNFTKVTSPQPVARPQRPLEDVRDLGDCRNG